MSEWERVFLQNLALPPHCQRRRARPPGSTAFRCVLKHLEGAALTQVRGHSAPWGRAQQCLLAEPSVSARRHSMAPPGFAVFVGQSP